MLLGFLCFQAALVYSLFMAEWSSRNSARADSLISVKL